VRLKWSWTTGSATRFQFDETSSGDSTAGVDSAKGTAVSRMQLRRSGRIATLSASCESGAGQPATVQCSAVSATVESDRFAISADGGATFTPMQEMAVEDTAIVRLTDAGRWEEVRDGRRVAAGHLVDLLSSITQLTLPYDPVAPGDRWPVRVVRDRVTRSFGRIHSDFRGEATFDSLVGNRAWLTLRGVDSAIAGSKPMISSEQSTISWNLDAGAPESVAIEETIEFPPPGDAPEAGRVVRMRIVRTVRRLTIEALPAERVP
jgi:hypothetical protein